MSSDIRDRYQKSVICRCPAHRQNNFDETDDGCNNARVSDTHTHTGAGTLLHLDIYTINIKI